MSRAPAILGRSFLDPRLTAQRAVNGRSGQRPRRVPAVRDPPAGSANTEPLLPAPHLPLTQARETSQRVNAESRSLSPAPCPLTRPVWHLRLLTPPNAAWLPPASLSHQTHSRDTAVPSPRWGGRSRGTHGAAWRVSLCTRPVCEAGACSLLLFVSEEADSNLHP